jgi:ATP-binding cassette subfamily B (MDR/TAP) protein 1
LYTGTIRDNILADKDDVPEEAVIQATKDANIYEFIVSSPPTYRNLNSH